MTDVTVGDSPEKVSKKEANYREASSTDRCGNCANFIEPDGCQVVEGLIRVDQISDLYQPVQQQTDADVETAEAALFGGPTA
jgi:hypothetical protein